MRASAWAKGPRAGAGRQAMGAWREATSRSIRQSPNPHRPAPLFGRILPAPGRLKSFPQLWKTLRITGACDDRDLDRDSQASRGEARPERAEDLVCADAPGRARGGGRAPHADGLGAQPSLRRVDRVAPRGPPGDGS